MWNVERRNRIWQEEVGSDLVTWEKFKALAAKKPRQPEKQARSSPAEVISVVQSGGSSNSNAVNQSRTDPLATARCEGTGAAAGELLLSWFGSRRNAGVYGV